MYCTNCGARLPDGTAFCTNCGTSMTVGQPAAAPTRKKTTAWKAIVIAAAAVIVTAGLVVGGIFLFGDRLSLAGIIPFFDGSAGAQQGPFYDGDSLMDFSLSDGVCFANMNGETASCDAGTYVISFDGTAAIAYDYGETLYYYADGDMREVAEGVTCASISADGDYVVYASHDGDACKLRRYRADTDEEELLDKTRNGMGVEELAASPDGQTVMYAVTDWDEVELFLCQDGQEPEPLGDDRHPIAVSNKAEYVYFSESNDSEAFLYAMHGGDEVKVATVDDSLQYFCINLEGDELCFVTSDATYLSVRGEKAERLLSGEGVIDYVGGIQLTYASLFGLSDRAVFLDGIDSYCNALWWEYNDDGYITYTLRYVDSDAEVETIDDEVSDYLQSDAGRKLLYLSDGELLYMSDYTKIGKTSRVFEEGGILRFDATLDFKHLYVLTDDGELYHGGLKGRWERIDKNVSVLDVHPQTGACCYDTDDGQTFCVDVGGEPQCVSDIIEGKTSFYWRNGKLLCRKDTGNNGYDYYTIHEDLSYDLLVGNAWW